MKSSKNTIANLLFWLALAIAITPVFYIGHLYHQEIYRKTIYVKEHNCKVLDSNKNFTYFNWEDNKIETAPVRIRYQCNNVDGPIIIRESSDDNN
jgi:hypothetical protein